MLRGGARLHSNHSCTNDTMRQLPMDDLDLLHNTEPFLAMEGLGARNAPQRGLSHLSMVVACAGLRLCAACFYVMASQRLKTIETVCIKPRTFTSSHNYGRIEPTQKVGPSRPHT